MNLIGNLTTAPRQKTNFVLDDGTSFAFTIYFVPMQYGWFITNLTYQNFSLNGFRVVNNANMLFQWQNILPFGIGCFSPSQREPTLQQDFATAASQLFVLNQAECEAYASYIKGGPLPS